MKPRLCILTLLLAILLPVKGQQVEWAVDFSTVFDNRECDNRYVDTKTIFQSQLAPEVGLSFYGGKHSMMGGVVWTQPLGMEWEHHRLSPTLYYRYTGKKGWTMAFGMFPRNLMKRPFASYIWSDSLRYNRHNINGAMASYGGRNGYFEAVLDWRSAQTATQREAFNIIVQGEWQPSGSIFTTGGTAMMNHFALTHPSPPDQHIVDNFIINPTVGVDLSRHIAPLDSLAIRTGMLMALTRNRGLGMENWKTPSGLWIDAVASWRWLSVQNTCYVGRTLYPFYTRFGALLDMGEPYYQSPWYNRTTISGNIVANRFVNVTTALDFNLAEKNTTFYQKLIVRVYIDSRYRRLSKKYKLSTL